MKSTKCYIIWTKEVTFNTEIDTISNDGFGDSPRNEIRIHWFTAAELY